MLKNRSFLIGVGAGIIIGALLFQLMLSGEQSRERLGTMGTKLEDKLYSQEEVDAMIKKELNSQKINEEQLPEVTPESGKESSTSLEDDKTASQAPTETAVAEVSNQPTEEPEKAEEPALLVIRIEPGSNLTKTSELLADYNILADKAAFISQMKKSKKQVRAGYFLFHENSTVKEAITVVTGQPLTKSEAELKISKK